MPYFWHCNPFSTCRMCIPGISHSKSHGSCRLTSTTTCCGLQHCKNRHAGGNKRRPNLVLVLMFYFLLWYLRVNLRVFAWDVLGLVSSVPSQAIGWLDCVRSDPFCIEWDVQTVLAHAFPAPLLRWLCWRLVMLSESHLLKHGEPQYRCRYCTFVTRQQQSLRIHERRIHTNYRPHLCETCGKSFVKSTLLREHINGTPECIRCSELQQRAATPLLCYFSTTFLVNCASGSFCPTGFVRVCICVGEWQRCIVAKHQPSWSWFLVWGYQLTTLDNGFISGWVRIRPCRGTPAQR